MSEEFIHEICDNHEDFKSLIAEIENHYVMYDCTQLRNAMSSYFELLSEHIIRENKIILSVAAEFLTPLEKENIYKLFEKMDKLNGEKEELKKILYKINMQIIK